ncbi:MAG: tRNA (N(6)-L-threonylcarbamoyladenosine(37)-C(2))-methylthiotransferase MtaB [Hyphomicrobiales bacterium]|nr:tRNA (N(6)-L-threonylcarbamoyladenosine(37)-C(2))-methylthiotransferase MtaB [Hyphomicrobiales bacterium]MCP5371839.1 tRNA (N(6)-L-threonylcarbamoyladenosine(37)-C(2))-methylthiotransferase MtaB [Hyphomicrobiales bacterium]
MPESQIITLGCRLNAFESEVMREQARAAGLSGAVIVNTCAVTAEAERQARQTIRRLRRENPDAPIIVTGCAAQLDPARFAAMPEVDRVLGNAEKLDGARLADAGGPAVQVADIMALRETAGHLIGGFENRARVFVQVQQGCDHRCTFCIIPFARGPNRSLPADAIVDQVRRLVAEGYGEVVLTGVDISSYGMDSHGQSRLGALAAAILARVPDLARLRLSSLDPAAVDGEVLRLLAEEPRFMPHLHLSLQAMDDLVLKRMKRRHDRAQALDLAARARRARPDVALGADLIAGFPTEDEDMFRRTLDAVEEMGLTFLHVFPYSARPGTPAARMPTLPGPVRRERAARLRTAGDAALARFLDGHLGRRVEVLVEQDNGGHSAHFAPVELDFDADPGALVAARVSAVADGRLVGSLPA